MPAARQPTWPTGTSIINGIVDMSAYETLLIHLLQRVQSDAG